jgi:hypothetical protein
MTKSVSTPTKAKKKSELIKSFKASSEVENFYRFVFENSVRHEARTLLQVALEKVAENKKSGSKKRSRKKKLQ